MSGFTFGLKKVPNLLGLSTVTHSQQPFEAFVSVWFVPALFCKYCNGCFEFTQHHTQVMIIIFVFNLALKKYTRLEKKKNN